jgi:hypothetical protein
VLSLPFVALAAGFCLIAAGCRTSDPHEATADTHVGSYVWAGTTLNLAADGHYTISSRDEVGQETTEQGYWTCSETTREFRLDRTAGDFKFAVRRLRVDDRNPGRLLWIPDLNPNSLRGAIEFVAFERNQDQY